MAVPNRDLVVNVVDLLRRPASRHHLHVEAAAYDIVVGDARIPAGAAVDVDVELESLSDGITVTGHVRAPWEGECRRCLGPARGELDLEVRELFQVRPTSDEAYEFDGEQLDLDQMVRENLALELPLAPVCRPDCQGLCPVCGANRNEVDCGHRPDLGDPRWAALEDLKARLEDPEA